MVTPFFALLIVTVVSGVFFALYSPAALLNIEAWAAARRAGLRAYREAYRKVFEERTREIATQRVEWTRRPAGNEGPEDAFRRDPYAAIDGIMAKRGAK